MDDIEARIAALHERLEKFNPYHAKDGRFTGAQGAHFVSTTNAKTTARMRQAHADQKAKEEAAKPKAPTLAERAKQLEQMKLPALGGGSEKQIDWAYSLRAHTVGVAMGAGIHASPENGGILFPGGSLNHLELKARQIIGAIHPSEATAKTANAAIAAIESLRGETSAKFWIDNRHKSGVQLISERSAKLQK